MRVPSEQLHSLRTVHALLPADRILRFVWVYGMPNGAFDVRLLTASCTPSWPLFSTVGLAPHSCFHQFLHQEVVFGLGISSLTSEENAETSDVHALEHVTRYRRELGRHGFPCDSGSFDVTGERRCCLNTFLNAWLTDILTLAFWSQRWIWLHRIFIAAVGAFEQSSWAWHNGMRTMKSQTNPILHRKKRYFRQQFIVL